MMTAKEKAQQLVVQYKIVLMDEDTECGNEILCTTIAKKIALTTVDEILNNDGFTTHDNLLTEYWYEVKQEIENL